MMNFARELETLSKTEKLMNMDEDIIVPINDHIKKLNGPVENSANQHGKSIPNAKPQLQSPPPIMQTKNR